MANRLKEWARGIKRDVRALYLASRDPRVPWYAKALGLAVAAYALSPIDLIPDRMGPLGLIDDLVVAFVVVWWLRRNAGALRTRTTARQRARGPAPSQPRAGEESAPWDPHAVLGIPRGAPADEVTRAYRTQMKLYHPDRVADLGPELQQVAHRKVLEIQRAYRELGGA